MIRHDHKRVQLVAFESSFAIGKGVHNQFGNFRLTQEDGTPCWVIEQAVHSGERLTGRQSGVRKGTVDWKTSMQTKRNEHSLANYVPMRKTPVIPAHVDLSSGRGLIVSGNFGITCAGRKPGGRAEALPHVSLE
jgi:hypothetical protein